MWLTDQLRLTAFFGQGAQVARDGWWETVSSVPPEELSQRPKEGIFDASGLWEHGGTLVLHVEPGRADFRLGFEVDIDAKSPSWAQVLPAFSAAMGNWCAKLNGNPVRLAFGAILVQPSHNREEAYAGLQKLLPFEVDTDMHDFFYQVNRPRQSTVAPDLTINRLIRWSAVRRAGVQIRLSGGATEVREVSSEYGVRMEADMNTLAERSEPLPELSALWDELVGLTVEISERGDVK